MNDKEKPFEIIKKEIPDFQHSLCPPDPPREKPSTDIPTLEEHIEKDE